MIIVDYSGLAIATIVVNKVDDENLLRHMILNSLRQYRVKYKRDFGELVLAIDGKNNWRRGYYPQYKANRKKKREEDTFDWAKAFSIMHDIKEEILANFPYKVIEVDECEADDIIGELCANTQEFGQYEDVMIISADKDFLQLQRYPNVRQYSPLLKKEYKEDAPLVGLMEKIMTGDAGDGVPNVLSPDNTFVDGLRQRPLGKKKIQSWVEHNIEDVLPNDEVKRNYQRNKKLIDLTEVPHELFMEITKTWAEAKTNPRSKLLNYFIQNRLSDLMDCIGDF